MDEKIRQGTGSAGQTTATGTAAPKLPVSPTSPDTACGCPQPGPETIWVEQVLGAEMSQQVLEMDMQAPEGKPDIEQIIDVYVKNVEVTSIDVIPNKVVIRGNLEVKVMYAADLPTQPVYALERRPVKFTRDIGVEGAERGMKAQADVAVEYVNYDFRDHDRRSVHVTIVLKFWARVMTTMPMDVYTTGVAGETILSSGMEGMPPAGGETMPGQVAKPNVSVGGITPTAGKKLSAGGIATVTGSNVNIRTGPGTNFPVVTKVEKGAALTIKEQAFGWYKVVLPDGATIGWVASWLVNAATAKG